MSTARAAKSSSSASRDHRVASPRRGQPRPPARPSRFRSRQHESPSVCSARTRRRIQPDFTALRFPGLRRAQRTQDPGSVMPWFGLWREGSYDSIGAVPIRRPPKIGGGVSFPSPLGSSSGGHVKRRVATTPPTRQYTLHVAVFRQRFPAREHNAKLDGPWAEAVFLQKDLMVSHQTVEHPCPRLARVGPRRMTGHAASASSAITFRLWLQLPR